jgi:hypothetical protein
MDGINIQNHLRNDNESNGGYRPPIVNSQQPTPSFYSQVHNQPNYMQQAHQLTVQQQ